MIDRDQRRSDEIGFNPYSGAYHNHHDWTSAEPLSHTITRTISALTGIGPDAGRPLSESIDTDALDRLFVFHRSENDADDHLTFTHQGCTVTIYRDGHVVVYPPGPDR